MTECVAVIRLRNGDDVLAILVGGEIDQMIRVEHPYFVKFNSATSNLMMVPYCALSDETYFEINRDRVEFVVPASFDIADKFLKMVDSAEAVLQAKSQELIEQDNHLDQLTAKLSNKNLIDGNDTKH